MTFSIPKTMRAWQFTSGTSPIEDNFWLNVNAPLPDGSESLQADQVLVEVHVTSLNPVDYKFAEVPVLGPLIVGNPSTPCMDYAGRVAAVGPNSNKETTADLRPGQLVFGRLDFPCKFGTLAEYAVVPRRGCVAVPPGVSLEDAACASSVAFTAYWSIVPKIKGHCSERVFLNGGSGGCGTYGIQIAKLMGCHVTTTCSTRNVQLCRELGADKVLDYTKLDVVSELQKADPFHLVVDNVGIPTNLYWHTPSFTVADAPYVQVGALAVSLQFMLGNAFKRHWPGLLGGGKRPWEFLQIKSNVADYVEICKWMQSKELRAVVDEVFEMGGEGPIKAFEKLKTGRARGKVLVRVVNGSK